MSSQHRGIKGIEISLGHLPLASMSLPSMQQCEKLRVQQYNFVEGNPGGILHFNASQFPATSMQSLFQFDVLFCIVTSYLEYGEYLLPKNMKLLTRFFYLVTLVRDDWRDWPSKRNMYDLPNTKFWEAVPRHSIPSNAKILSST
jgi:hypothetical protein